MGRETRGVVVGSQVQLGMRLHGRGKKAAVDFFSAVRVVTGRAGRW